MATLSEPQREALARALRLYADHMQLRDWTVTVKAESTQDPEHGAEAEVRIESQHVLVAFRQDVAYLEPAEVRRLLVHELAHCYTERTHELLAKALGPALGVGLSRAADAILEVEAERLCEAMAYSLAPHLPAFSWADGGEAAEAEPQKGTPPPPPAEDWDWYVHDEGGQRWGHGWPPPPTCPYPHPAWGATRRGVPPAGPPPEQGASPEQGPPPTQPPTGAPPDAAPTA